MKHYLDKISGQLGGIKLILLGIYLGNSENYYVKWLSTIIILLGLIS